LSVVAIKQVKMNENSRINTITINLIKYKISRATYFVRRKALFLHFPSKEVKGIKIGQMKPRSPKIPVQYNHQLGVQVGALI
jgi:hypothetical protein